MDGTLSTWSNGKPVLLHATGDLSTWSNGQPFTFIGAGSPPPATSKIKTAIGMARSDVKTAIGIAIGEVKNMIGIDN